MARNDKSFFTKTSISIAFAIALVIALGAAFLFFGASRKFSNLSSFPTVSYLENSGLFSQEDFKIFGSVDNVLLRSANAKMFLASIKPADSDLLLPVIISPDNKNLQRNQQLVMRVHIAQNGSIVCSEYETK